MATKVTNLKQMTTAEKLQLTAELSEKINNAHYRKEERDAAVKLLNLISKYPAVEDTEVLPEQFDLEL
jgi:hypothetical protein